LGIRQLNPALKQKAEDHQIFPVKKLAENICRFYCSPSGKPRLY
jgi:hypothetical protein